MKKRSSLFLAIFFLSSLLLGQEDKALSKNHDMLEISKNFLKTYEVHGMFSDSKRTLGRLNNINFSMKPLISPIKPFDALKAHYAYPLKIFLPKGTTVTSAKLSNSTQSPTFSQNVVTVEIDKVFESGLLDIVYISGFDTKSASYLSVKLDVYVPPTQKKEEIEQLYTQVEYYEPKRLKNSEIIAALKPEEYENSHSRLTYMGVLYDIHLVSVVKDTKIVKRLKDDKYINAGILHNGMSYNYYIK